MMDADTIIKLVSSLGFPAVVTFILLYQYHVAMMRLSQSMEHLSSSIKEFQSSFFDRIRSEVKDATEEAVGKEMAKWLHGVRTERLERTIIDDGKN